MFLLQDLEDPHFLTATLLAYFLTTLDAHFWTIGMVDLVITTLVTFWTLLQELVILLTQVVVFPFLEQETLALIPQAFLKHPLLQVANLFWYLLVPTTAPALAKDLHLHALNEVVLKVFSLFLTCWMTLVLQSALLLPLEHFLVATTLTNLFNLLLGTLYLTTILLCCL